ncbi:MFS transporter [Rhodopirellula sp. MGV]|uniref:MFS transporter n=1 Tax=Rhodopirellula sp. MGV TaxID=2023130 RepID=UPI000B963DD3|nr:MFS transporter [Rhodopirellula sp. MGV]OYP38828.1 MFS transporter [Rhodopirellula sp. MGV]PNY37639.1 MFS transporter [Rhodopirellula baltica]
MISTRTKWIVCFIAAVGFAFDIYELLMLPLILRPALAELGGIAPGTPEFEYWRGVLFFVPAMIGGIVGLGGGYLTDTLGRRRVLTFSILLYAFAALACGFVTSLPMLLVCRCLVFVGVCVEFVAAVAWLAELFDDAKQREAALGYTQAFSSIGGLLVTAANLLAIRYATSLPEIAGGHEAWRYTVISGVIPALPLILVRPFLPESPKWQEKKLAGQLRRPSLKELFSPELRKTTIVTTLMFACSYGAAFGALQQTPSIVPGLEDVQSQTESMSVPQRKQFEQQTAATVNGYQEIGGLIGRFVFATMAIYVVSRRRLLRLFQWPGLIVVPLVYFVAIDSGLMGLKLGIFFAGLLTVAQFSFWGNYLPQVFPLHLRGTGESFAANIGGRMIGTSFAAVTAWLITVIPSHDAAFAAGAVALGTYLVGSVLSFFLEEPKPETAE